MRAFFFFWGSVFFGVDSVAIGGMDGGMEGWGLWMRGGGGRGEM